MQNKRPEFIVSGCLAGLNCRFDGTSSPCAKVMELVISGRAIVVCPESLSGLPVPRPPCEQRNSRVVSADGKDVSKEFELGAERALKKALACGCNRAILKARSPSCGINQIYDGTFSKRLTAGNGVFARKLLACGFTVWDEDNLPDDI